MPAPARSRLSYVDWMRGLACLLMFQTHAYDSWLGDDWRHGRELMYSQLLGTFPAPLFLFLAGFAVALGIDRMEAKGASRWEVASAFAKRGGEVFGIALLFRLQQWVMGFGWSPWTDLLRVDILNTIGISLALAAVVPLAAQRLWPRVTLAAGFAAGFALLTPPLWSTTKLHVLPWWLASYINGGHLDYTPRGWYFPIFPWSGFLFVGVAAGLIVMRARRTQREGLTILVLAALGGTVALLSRWIDHLPGQFYAVYNYWLTSPNFFLARAGLLLVILAGCYGWCALKPGKLWSPMEQLGSTSLLVYWVHIELVYGRLSILPKHRVSFATASWGLAAITVSMTLLSLLKTRWDARRRDERMSATAPSPA
jgi:uncharacterized membrane protein